MSLKLKNYLYDSIYKIKVDEKQKIAQLQNYKKNKTKETNIISLKTSKHMGIWRY
jgi:hypothetical protein